MNRTLFRRQNRSFIREKQMKRNLSSTPRILLAAALCASSILLTGLAASAQDGAQVRLAYVTPKGHAFGIGADAFIKKLTELTGGRFEVLEFPAGALGGERENVEQLQIGALQVSITTSGVLGNFVPELGIIDLPFLFRNADHAHSVLDGEIGNELVRKLEPIGIRGLCWGESGFRQVYSNNGRVTTPNDLRGLKIRTMEVPEHILAFQALGAAPTAIALPELFTALQQGTVDALEGPAQAMLSGKYYEVQKFLSFTNHLYAGSLVLISNSFFNSLSADDQRAFQAAATYSCNAQREFVGNNEEDVVLKLRDLGVTVTDSAEVDREAFIEALKPAYEKYAEKFGADSIERVRGYK